MVDEGQVVSHMQISEAVLNSLHSDGTTRDHSKFVGMPLSLDTGEVVFFYLDFEPVSKEDANTLLDLFISVLAKLSDCSGPITVDSPDDVFKNIL